MGQNEQLLNVFVLGTLQTYTEILKVSGALKPLMLQFKTQVGTIIESNARISDMQGSVNGLKSIMSLIDEIVQGMAGLHFRPDFLVVRLLPTFDESSTNQSLLRTSQLCLFHRQKQHNRWHLSQSMFSIQVRS